MKRIVIVVLLVLVAVGMFASGPGDTNGYDWITFSDDEKVKFVTGALAGISYANIVLIGYAADRIPSLTFSDILRITVMVNIFYEDVNNRSIPVVVSIVMAWNVFRGG